MKAWEYACLYYTNHSPTAAHGLVKDTYTWRGPDGPDVLVARITQLPGNEWRIECFDLQGRKTDANEFTWLGFANMVGRLGWELIDRSRTNAALTRSVPTGGKYFAQTEISSTYTFKREVRGLS